MMNIKELKNVYVVVVVIRVHRSPISMAERSRALFLDGRGVGVSSNPGGPIFWFSGLVDFISTKNGKTKTIFRLPLFR